MSFSAVVTTGIYCQPSCSARPNPENVRSFASPAAAEAAGFRACLRCRPYRAAQTLEEVGPELVCRAVHLIIDGALDEGTEQQLGSRLGVSARHLRRIFTEHVGATPDQLARSRRAHFARRLLDDTDLTVTEIAFASGFGSLRQCNRAMRQVFAAAPLELRARRRVSDRLVADGGLMLRIAVPDEYDWERQVDQLRRAAVAGMEHVDGSAYRRIIRVERSSAVIELRAGEAGAILMTAHLPHWDGLIHLVDRARRLIGLGEPASAGSWNPFEAAVRAMVGEWVSARCARELLGDLVARCGTSVAGLKQLGLTQAFPSARQVARFDLGAVGLSESRSECVRSLARAVGSGRIQLDGSESREALVARLEALPKVPPAMAEVVASTLDPLQEVAFGGTRRA